MVTLVEEMRQCYRSSIVIFDLPPHSPHGGRSGVLPYTDALPLTVEKGKPTVDEVQQALSLVTKSHPMLGTVRNKAGQLAARPKRMRKLLEREVEE